MLKWNLQYADCHGTNTGLFLGLMLTVITVTVFIIFAILAKSCATVNAANAISNWYEGFLMAVMIVATGLAYYKVILVLWNFLSSDFLLCWGIKRLGKWNFIPFKIAHLEVNPHPISMLDDLLLFICIPSFFLYTFFNLAPEALGNTMARPDASLSIILEVGSRFMYMYVHFI